MSWRIIPTISGKGQGFPRIGPPPTFWPFMIGLGKISWRREWLPTPVFLPWEFHGQKSLAGYRPGGCKELDTTEQLMLSFSELSWCLWVCYLVFANVLQWVYSLVYWKLNLPPSWIWLILTNFCHVLWPCHSFKGCFLHSSFLFHQWLDGSLAFLYWLVNYKDRADKREGYVVHLDRLLFKTSVLSILVSIYNQFTHKAKLVCLKHKMILFFSSNFAQLALSNFPMDSLFFWASLVAQLVKNPPAMWETWVWSLGWEDPLEKGKATHSSILA